MTQGDKISLVKNGPTLYNRCRGIYAMGPTENTITDVIKPSQESPGVDPLFCSTCGVILTPVEVTLDVGDGPELLCDACLLGPGAG